MSSRPWLTRLQDILQSIESIGEYTSGMTGAEFLADKKTVRAVAYEFVIIGEAARTIPAEVQRRFPDIPWAKMRGLRNVAIHEYSRVDESILRQTLTDDLPPVAARLRAILEGER